MKISNGVKKIITIVIVVIVVAGLGYWIYPYLNPTTPEEKSDAEQACIASGGQVKTSTCCQTTSDFPNSCLVGPCGCAPAYSHEVKICDCGEGKCFDGSKCAASETGGEADELEDEVSSFLETLKRETRIGFSEMQSVEFEWNVKKYEKIEAVTIQGKGFEANGITSQQYEKVEAFFKDKGFEVDIYNVAAGTISELTGYKKDLIVCTVAAGASGYKEATGQWIPSEQDVEVKCGQGGSEITPLISKEEAIQKLFAEKYKTKASAIALNISKETANHVKGTIKVLDLLAEGGAGEKGIFLAAKVNNKWGLVGEEVEKYNFPEDTAIETKSGDNFFVVLDSNPTTGYGWQLDFDSNYVQLVNGEYIAPTEKSLVGAGGDETFNFLTLKSGKTEITFSYLREWEKDKAPLEKKVFEITIK